MTLVEAYERKYVNIAVDLSGCDSDVAVPHRPHEYPKSSAFGRIAWGVGGLNAAKQPIQDPVLKEMQRESMVGEAYA